MTITARKATAKIATDSADLLDLILIGLAEEFDTCAICGHAAAELYTRIDDRDGSEVECCETCADSDAVSTSDHIDA